MVVYASTFGDGAGLASARRRESSDGGMSGGAGGDWGRSGDERNGGERSVLGGVEAGLEGFEGGSPCGVGKGEPCGVDA